MATSSRQSADARKADGAVIRAPSLKEALRKARVLYGDDVRLIESRHVVQRQDDRLGQEQLMEIVVDAGGEMPILAARPAGSQVPRKARSAATSRRIVEQVERIERLVDQIAGGNHRRGGWSAEMRAYPLAAPLLASGASTSAVRRLCRLFQAETEEKRADLPAAVAHLRSHLRTGQGDWADLGGCHVFLGDCGAGKTDAVLAIAARLQGMGKKPLVLSLMPRHGGEVRRLQLEAAEHNYDAAVIQHMDQLSRLEEHISGYEAVLIDTPSLFAPCMVEDGKMQCLLGQNERFHRHLVVPMDQDFRLGGCLWEAARIWNCDWIVATRMDRSGALGKLLDLYGTLQLPISILTSGPWPDSPPQLAVDRELANRLIGRELKPRSAAARA